jgi:hypothetical protein
MRPVLLCVTQRVGGQVGGAIYVICECTRRRAVHCRVSHHPVVLLTVPSRLWVDSRAVHCRVSHTL